MLLSLDASAFIGGYTQKVVTDAKEMDERTVDSGMYLKLSNRYTSLRCSRMPKMAPACQPETAPSTPPPNVIMEIQRQVFEMGKGECFPDNVRKSINVILVKVTFRA